MALLPSVLHPNLQYFSPSFTCYLKRSFKSREASQKGLQSNLSRRIGAIAAMASVLLAREVIFSEEIANGLDFRMTTPDQTVEEAESGIRSHAQALLEVKALIESGSWVEAQKALRKSSSYLKQDIYTIIQDKPGNKRPQLRKLYTNLFNYVTRLDYAARDKDATRVWECYENIVVALDDILSRL
ncbi:hypothetical protein L1049_021398 [Liquidambar formosana]|uniref:PQL-like protein n=1 Tax=Liquidambar formosana TaxID=63359 RepID=A0AAP0N9H1_LIQFO